MGVIVIILDRERALIVYELADGSVVPVRKRGDIAAFDVQNIRQKRADGHAVRDNGDGLTLVFYRYLGNGGDYAHSALGKALRSRRAPLRRIVVEIVHLHRVKSVHITEAHALAYAEINFPEPRREPKLKLVILCYRARGRHRAAQIA